MEIRQLLYFVEISAQKSFSKAAERLHISQQGISMAIFRLEEELSCKLFLRLGKELQLTEQGEFLLPHAEEIVREMQVCEEYFNLQKSSKHLVKSIRVSSSYGVMPEFAGELVFSFRQKYPDIWLGIQEGSDVDCEDSVWDESTELGLTMAPIDAKRFTSTALFRRRYCMIVHKSHPFADRKIMTISALRTTPIMMMDKRSKTNQIVRNCCQQQGFEPIVQFTAGEIIAIHRLVGANSGVGITVESVVEDLPHPDICCIPFAEPEMVWETHLIKKRGIKLSPIAKTFEKYVINEMLEKRGLEP